MRFEDVKLALQPTIDDDLEALYGAFVQEAGGDDVEGFLSLLHEGDLIDQATYDAMMEGFGGKVVDRLSQLEAMKVSGDDGLKSEFRRVVGESPGKRKRDELIADILAHEESLRGGAPSAEALEEDTGDAATVDGPPAGPPPVPAELAKASTPAPVSRVAGPPKAADPKPADPADTFEDEPTAAQDPSKLAGADEDDDEDEDDEATTVRRKGDASGDNTPPGEADDGGPPRPKTPTAEQALADVKAEKGEDEDEESPTGTYIMDQEGNNTNPAGDVPKKRERREGRREGSRTGARTGQRRSVRDTGETETGARKRGARERKTRKAQANASIAGKGYEFIGELGQGAMGAVLKARDLDLNRVVAFKTMSAEIAASPLSGKFIGEAQITAQLEHPNIIPIYGLEATDKGELAYSMKMVRGRTFEDLILECHEIYDGKKKMDDGHTMTRRLEFFLYVCEAMHYAHRRGVVHRDLKPENLMIGPYDEVYVMDWGISKVFNPEVHQDGEEPVTLSSDMDEEGELIIGTPQYMSPEQAHGQNEDLDGLSDQYALGLILYELISLKQAVTGKAPLKIVMRQQDGEKNPLVHYKKNETIPIELKAIALKACDKEKSKRYADVAALGDDIRRYMRSEETIAKPDNLLQKFFRFLSRHRELTALFIMGTFAVLAGLVILSLMYSAYQSKLAYDRENRIQSINTMISQQSAIIDGTFVHYEGLLGVAKATATDMLNSGDMTSDPIYFGADFDAAEKPPGTFKSDVYGMDINIDHPAYFLPEGVEADDVQVSMRRLEPMRRHQRRILLRSKDEKEGDAVPRRAERLIGEIGVPLAWAHVGLENGLYAGFPGHGGYPPQWDPRDLPWYTLAKNSKVPTWGAPYPDYFELGAILPCATGIYDNDANFVGVVAVEMTFDFIIGKLLEIDGMFNKKLEDEKRVEFLLVDNEGRVVVRSSKKDVKVRGHQLPPRPLRLSKFEHDVIREDIDKRMSGMKEVGDHMIFYNRLNSLGWYYIVAGESDVMLDANAQ